MRERVHDDRHHHESRHNEDDIGNSGCRIDMRSNELSEYDIIECRRDHGRDDRLLPDTQESGDFLADNRHIGDIESVWGHRMNA